MLSRLMEIEKKTLVRLKILSGVLLENTNQWLINQKEFAGLDKYEIRQTYFKSIFSLVFEIFLSSNLLVRRK